MSDPRIELCRARIRDVPDFPRPGILFKDITPLLSDGEALGAALDLLAERYAGRGADAVVAVESRGFVLGGALAARLRVGLALVRKPGKLPAAADRERYALEYGEGVLEMHTDALRPGQRVVVIDDVLATGGTAAAACALAERRGATVVECGFLIELGFLHGRARVAPRPVWAVLVY
jgi:adenine phosphoribosyltransferase